jgi:hypothetical protein
MRLLLSCKEQSNSFELNTRDYLWALGVTKSKDFKIEDDKNEKKEIAENEDDTREKEKKKTTKNFLDSSCIFSTMQKYLVR